MMGHKKRASLFLTITLAF